jgi:hypothetical protein
VLDVVADSTYLFQLQSEVVLASRKRLCLLFRHEEKAPLTQLPFEVLAGVLYWLPGTDPGRFPQMVPRMTRGRGAMSSNSVLC